MVVARTRPHDGCAAATGEVLGAGEGLAWSATAGPNASPGRTSEPTSGLLAAITDLAVPSADAAASPGFPVADASPAVPAELATSQTGSHQPASQAGSHLSSSQDEITGIGSVGAPSHEKVRAGGPPQLPSSSIPSPPPWLSGTAEHMSSARINRNHRLHPMHYGPQQPHPRPGAAVGRLPTGLAALLSDQSVRLCACPYPDLAAARQARAITENPDSDSITGTDPAPAIVTSMK